MTMNRLMAGGRGVRSFTPRSWARPPGLALLALALIGVAQAGCRSDGCTNCGLGSKISSGVQALTARVTKHFDGCGGGMDCGCGSGGETVVDSGIPVISGGMVVPPPGALMSPPSMESAPTQLEPLSPSSSNGSPSSIKSTSPSGNTRSSYTASVPKGLTAQRRGQDVNRALLSSPDAGSTDLFDHLPPVDLSNEVTKNATTVAKPTPTPAPTPAAPTSSPSPAASPSATSPTANAAAAPAPITPSAPSADATTTPSSAEKVSAVEGAIGTLPAIPTPSPFQQPGIRRHASVAPSLAGGSSPSMEGLDWLKEKGCRTFVDLRKSSEVDPNFVEAVNDRNMVYISLPIVANRLDPARLARFDDLIAQSDNRPLYFADTDGSRSALVWYIHLRVVGQEDAQSATGKAEELGLTEAEVQLAETYLLTHKPKPRVASAARVALATPADKPEPKSESPPSPSTAVPAPVAPRSALPGGSPAGVSPASPPTPSTDPSPSMLPGEDRPQASTIGGGRFRDPMFWRPVAALVLASIGVPLAYWSRSAFTSSRSKRPLASLTGTVQTPSDVPVGSDA